MEINVKEVGWVEKLFSRESDLVEDEGLFVEGLGWVIFRVEDNAGSITVWLSKERIDEFPIEDEEWISRSQAVISSKLCFYGSFGPSEKGNGAFMSRLTNNEYTDKEPFDTFAKGERLLEEYLNKFKS
jgi:hypothetical protein